MSVLRQFKSATSNTTAETEWSATFDSAPLAGSLLVAVAGYIGSGTTVWNVSFPGFTTLVAPDLGNIGLVAGAKLAGSAEPTSVFVEIFDGTTNSQSIVIAEFTGTFNSGSVTNALAEKDRTLTETAFTSADCPTLNVAGANLVVPVLGMNGQSSSPSADSGHTLIAHARPGTAHWHRASAAAWADVTDDATHAPTWSWTTGVTSVATGLMAFPLAASGSGMTLAGAVAPTVSLSWTDNAAGPWDVLRDSVEIASAVAGTSYTDSTVVEGATYTYQIRDSASSLSNERTVQVTAGGVFWLRRDGSGWAATPA